MFSSEGSAFHLEMPFRGLGHRERMLPKTRDRYFSFAFPNVPPCSWGQHLGAMGSTELGDGLVAGADHCFLDFRHHLSENSGTRAGISVLATCRCCLVCMLPIQMRFITVLAEFLQRP